jgi:hypothetical protein
MSEPVDGGPLAKECGRTTEETRAFVRVMLTAYGEYCQSDGGPEARARLERTAPGWVFIGAIGDAGGQQ